MRSYPGYLSNRGELSSGLSGALGSMVTGYAWGRVGRLLLYMMDIIISDWQGSDGSMQQVGIHAS